MTIRFSLAALAVAASLAPLPVSAQAPGASDPAAIAAAKELIDTTLSGEIADKMVEQSWPPIEQMLRAIPKRPTDDQISGLKTEYVAMMDKEMKDAMADSPSIYAKFFSAQELRDLLAFYKTETGKKTISVMPQLMGEIMQRTMQRMPAMMTRIKDGFTRVMKEKGVELPAPAGAPAPAAPR